MALYRQVGDRVDTYQVALTGTSQPIFEGKEKEEMCLSVGLQAPSTNPDIIYVGGESAQLWELPPGGVLTVNITRRRMLSVRGPTGNLLTVFAVLTTGELGCPPGA